ncbi:MptD family putative ECF transporter S component, partial [Finegoldia magna]
MKNRLTAKDLINVGIYTAIYLVIFFVTGMLGAVPILYPTIFILIPILTGIPFMLFLTKVEKFGMVSLMGIILGVFW